MDILLAGVGKTGRHIGGVVDGCDGANSLQLLKLNSKSDGPGAMDLWAWRFISHWFASTDASGCRFSIASANDLIDSILASSRLLTPSFVNRKVCQGCAVLPHHFVSSVPPSAEALPSSRSRSILQVMQFQARRECCLMHSDPVAPMLAQTKDSEPGQLTFLVSLSTRCSSDTGNDSLSITEEVEHLRCSSDYCITEIFHHVNFGPLS